MTDPHAKARRELAACERDHARGIHREIKGPELARRHAMSRRAPSDNSPSNSTERPTP